MIDLKEALIGKKNAKYADIEQIDKRYIVCTQTKAYKDIIKASINKNVIDQDLEFDFWILTELEISEIFLVRYVTNELQRGDIRFWRMSDFPYGINAKRLSSLLSNYDGGDKIGNITCLTLKEIIKIWL